METFYNQCFSNDLPHVFKRESSKTKTQDNSTRQGSILFRVIISVYQLHVGCCHELSKILLIIASKFLSFSRLVTILPLRGRGIQPPFNVIYSCLFIGRRYTCGRKRGERWRPAERESPDRGTSDEMAKELEDFNDRTCSVQYDATQFNDVPVNPLLSTMGSRFKLFFSRNDEI